MNLQDYFLQYEKAHRHQKNRFMHQIGIPVILISLVLILFTPYSNLGWILFAIGWIFQFIGHAIERTWPEFLKNPIYLLIGPLYLGHKIKKRFNSH